MSAAAITGPAYFTTAKVDEATFKHTIIDRLRIPRVTDGDRQDLHRFNEALNKMLTSAWADYQDTCKVFSENRIVTTEALTYFNFAEQVSENKIELLKKAGDGYFYECHSDGRVPNGILSIHPVSDAILFNEVDPDLTISSEAQNWLTAYMNQEIGKSLELPYWQTFGTNDCQIHGSPLVVHVSNTHTKHALLALRLGADLNKYTPAYGNNPVILAITKGWNHINTDRGGETNQKDLIKGLLGTGKADLNAIDLRNGMTPLHLACLRGDDPELVGELLRLGADKTLKDYNGKTPPELLDGSYESVQKIIAPMIGQTEFKENKCYTATLPTREERKANLEAIRKLL